MTETISAVVDIKDIIIAITGLITALGLFCGWFKKSLGITAIEEHMKQVKRDTIRIQLLYLWAHDPKNKDAIMSLYDEYRALGGNSFIVEMFEEWKKKHLHKK